VARLSLLPRDRTFFDLFIEAGQNALQAARLLDEMIAAWPDAGGLGRDILKAEQEGDRITHDIVRRLNTTFVTPIDREDIYGLATQMDDIVDYTEEAADFMGLYKIEAPMEQAGALTKVLVCACEQLAEGLEPWDTPEVWLGWSTSPNHDEDITGFLDTKIAALEAHVSQVKGDMLGFFKEWLPAEAEENGRRIGVTHAESFRRMTLT